jgi:dihydroorotase
MENDPKYNLLLKGGKVIDPKNNRNQLLDLSIKDRKIACVEPEIEAGLADKVVDLSGMYITPGLIDIHVHVYHTREPEGLSVIADHHSFRSGVTTVVDAGTAGANHFLHFKRTVIDFAKTRILAFINIVKSGMEGDFEHDIAEMDPELAASIVLAYPEICVGIKTAHYWTHQPCDDEHPLWAAVDRGLEAGDICEKPLMVDFWPRPGRTYPALLQKMRPDDIHTHFYAQQFPILDGNNKPEAYLFEARERGIIFDLGHGAGSFWFRQAVPVMEGGFGPDSISTDLHIGNINGPVFDMLTTMSKLMNMEMPLEDVIYRSTVTPAEEIGRPELGTFTIGADADIAVLKLEEGLFGFADCGKAKIMGGHKLTCKMTIRAGEVVYDPDGMILPKWMEAPDDYWVIRNPEPVGEAR